MGLVLCMDLQGTRHVWASEKSPVGTSKPRSEPSPPHPYNHKVVEAFYLFANHSLTEHVFAQEDMAVNLTDNAP